MFYLFFFFKMCKKRKSVTSGKIAAWPNIKKPKDLWPYDFRDHGTVDRIAELVNKNRIHC